MKNIYIAIFLFISSLVIAQNTELKGTVKEVSEHTEGHDAKNKDSQHLHNTPLPGANVYWLGTTTGTTTNNEGKFSLKRIPTTNKLIISYIGYQNDTIEINRNQQNIEIVLLSNKELREVVIKAGMAGDYISKFTPIQTRVITTEGLKKAACCNLSESFQNSATVTVNFADAVTGAKQIEMLGLSGLYSQILFENMPAIRGLASPFGMGYIPGPFMESIQVSKGTSSVINGYESTTGQINVEYKKPDVADKLYLNLFASDAGRFEQNILSGFKLPKNNKWSTLFLLHGEENGTMLDHNKDGFIDHPLINQVNFMNRWNYTNPDHFESKSGISIIEEDRKGGQVDYYKKDNPNAYGVNIRTSRYNLFTKNGFIFTNNRSLGTMLSATHHKQNSFFGKNTYNAIQNSIYANVIYQGILFNNTNHEFNAGTSFQLDDYNQNFNDSAFKTTEVVPGAFFQYQYNYLEALTIIGGIRSDYNSEYGLFTTPRVHAKYRFNEFNIMRVSAGKGYRVPQVFAENTPLLTTSRKWVFQETPKHEEAWNYGINYTVDFKIKKKKATFNIDFYRTDFVNQLVIDVDKDVQHIYIYNLKGKSYSNSLQADIRIEPLKGFELNFAYKINDVKVTTNEELKEKPLVNKYIGLISATYKTKFEKWQFDATAHLNGPSRLPNTSNNPIEYQLPDYSKPYWVLYAQITKKFKHFDVYLGAENLTNFTQMHPILSAHDPFSKHFDSSIVWGPILGRKIYAGLRYKL